MMTMMVMMTTKTTVCVHEETISEREQTPSRSRHCNDDNGEEEDSENGDNGEEGDNLSPSSPLSPSLIRMIWWTKAMMVKTMVRIKTMVTMGMSIEMMRRNPRFENGIPGFA